MKIPKRLRWWYHSKDGSNPTIIKTSVNGKPYVPRGMERREFLFNAAKMAAAGALGAGIASMGLPISASPPVNWNQGAGAMEEAMHYVIFPGGSSWYRRDGDTGKIGDSSEGDSPTTDPVPLINRTISAMSMGHALTVKGGFSSATTINFTVNIWYAHHGVFNYTGTGDAVYINTTSGASQNLTDPDTSAVITQPTLVLYIYALVGPNSTSPYTTNATAYGLHAFNCIYHNIHITRIVNFAEAVRIDQGGTGTTYSGYNNIAVDGIYVLDHIRNCNIAIHFAASSSSATGLTQTNKFLFDIENCAAYGILIDNLTTFNNNNAYQQFFGIIDNHGISGAHDYVNNQVQTDTNAGNCLMGFFVAGSTLGPGLGSSPGPKDTFYGNAIFSYISGGGLARPTTTVSGMTSDQTIATYLLSNSSAAQNDAVLLVGGMLNVTAYTSGTITLQVNYTDIAGNARSKVIGTAAATGDFPFADITIYAKKGTNVTITTTGGAVATRSATGTFDRKQ